MAYTGCGAVYPAAPTFAPSVMSLLTASHIGRQEDGKAVLNDISFSQQPLQNLAIAGATGSGKTTLLKIIAGLMEPSAGAVHFKGERIKGPSEKLLPGHPAIAYLSQHFELRNHYRVAELLEMAKKVSDGEALLVYEVCRIDHLLQRWTHQLSGGEKQRIALARLLVSCPLLLLLDEPFSNLDPFHKNVLKTVIEDVRPNLNITCLLVSHDPVDTLSWADEILVLKAGQLVQQASPQQVYSGPVDKYVAGLFGKYNLLTPSLAKALSPFSDIEFEAIGRFIRPEEFKLVGKGEGVKAQIEKRRFTGSFYEVEVSVAGQGLTVIAFDADAVKAGEIYIGL